MVALSYRLGSLALFLFGVDGARVNKRSGVVKGSQESGRWQTYTNAWTGPCSDHITWKGISDRPISFPLLCHSGSPDAKQMQVQLKTTAGWNQTVSLSVDGVQHGTKEQGKTMRDTHTWEVQDLSPGLHYIVLQGGSHYQSVRIESVTVSGATGFCSLDQATWTAIRTENQYTFDGFDVLNRLFTDVGGDKNFASAQKQKLLFASESVGTNADGSISASKVGNGIWQWLYQYSQKQASGDEWMNKGIMWNESYLEPIEVSLGHMSRHSGQKMRVQEPCNTLSNLAFDQAAVWIACKGYPFDRDEMASLASAYTGMAAGSAFLHACGCETGGRMDTFTMDWLMLQTYQSAVKQVVSDAGDRLTAAEKDAILTFGYPIGDVTDLAKDMTALFGEKYDHTFWNETVRAVQIPAYEKPIVGLISFVLWSLQGMIGYGTDVLLQGVLESLIDLFDLPDGEFFKNVYTPAVRKALGFSNLCKDAVWPVVEYTLKFIVTFVEALVYQEQRLPVPDSIKDIIKQLNKLGLSSDLLSDMVDSWDLYNGFDCNARSDHSSWHEKAAHGLVQFLNVASYFRTDVGC